MRKRFLASLEFPDPVSWMRAYERHWNSRRKAIRGCKTNWRGGICQGWAIGAAEYRQELKNSFADCEESAGWGGAEVQELREEKWARILSALGKAAGKVARRWVEKTNRPLGRLKD